MAQQNITIGSANGKSGDTLFNAFTKIEDNTTELYDLVLGLGFVPITKESDFPVQDETTITLEENTIYVLSASIESGKRFIYESSAMFTAFNALGYVWSYTGIGNMFTGVDGNLTLSHITLNCPNANFLDHTDTVGGNDIITLDFVRVAYCQAFATVRDPLAFIVESSLVVGAEQGVVVTGSTDGNIQISNLSLQSTSVSFIGLDLGSSITKLEVKDLIVLAPSGAFGISGLSSNGNIEANNIAMIAGCDFSGGVTALQNITFEDVRWSFRDNNIIPDTNPDCLVSLTGNTTPTIVSGGTPTLVLGTWNTAERGSHFTADTAGRIVHNGERELVGPVTISVTVEPLSGNNRDISAYVAVDGTFVANSKTTVRVDAANPKTISIPWQVAFSEGTFVEIFVSNDTNNISVIATSAIQRVR